MNKIHLSIFIIFFFIISSCKKEKPPLKAESCFLTQSNHQIGYDYYFPADKTFESDDQGRVIKMISKYAPLKESSATFTYSNSQIIETFTNTGGSKFTKIYKLDNQGRIVESNNYSGEFQLYYSYNKDGYLSKINYFVRNQLAYSRELVYTGGNLTKVIETEKNGIVLPDGNITIEYNDMGFKENFFIAYEYIPPGDDVSPVVLKYMGKSSKNLVSKIIASPKNINIYTYELDKKGNIIKLYHLNPGSANTYTPSSFSYNCKN
ncbi:DUF4595 domain-containing protein [Pedobacter cryoconitis]|uniref:Uncharacterized protein with porin-like fold DUF4595 n=1 Tax=Pedobacter cryoconitis TaxID=188932 RepID=A0A327SKR6_9SPHI|nr:DUF4595 domain-containing protein [Pedobacter cryoconitis]RAJ26337.1 uncharacterized protein with porin-like fold DUF4595 [Pedobacter cryoconitis]